MNSFRLIKDKNVGKVIFIVEGPKTEIYILKRILKDILNYNLVIKRNNKTRVEFFHSKINTHSKIYIINAEQSELVHISPGNEYIETLYVEKFNRNHKSVEIVR